MLEYFCVLPFFRCCQDGSQEKEANSPWNLVSNPTYNKRQGKVFQCNAISQKLDDQRVDFWIGYKQNVGRR